MLKKFLAAFAVVATFASAASAQQAVTCVQDRYGNISCPVMVSMTPAGAGTVPTSGIGNNETTVAVTAIQTLGSVYLARETFGHYYHRHHHHHHRHW
ncbi:MAG: hypothetical protein IK089_00030 [Oxalobacter sp.]|nr:hypothetical protein [Oxalobacter sp.]